MSGNIAITMEEKPAPVADDVPYFAEKFPGKVCCFCNLSERSALGQGDMLQLKIPPNVVLRKDPSERHKNDENEQSLYRKLKNTPKNRTPSGGSSDNTYELDKVGHSAIFDASECVDENYAYVHCMCAKWSLRKSQVTDADASHLLTILSECLERKCSFCNQYGASISCKMNCRQVYHWPCAAAAGCLLILGSYSVFCAEHLSQVPVICSDNNVECLNCSSLGDLSKLIMCCTCGDHFHSNCIGLANLPDTRAGWSCPRCTKCQICRQDSNDVRYVKCEQCQKIYHAMCLRPALSSIPKYGWKCNRCRVCTDCGSRTPGGGSSSRWHSHYTICDSCYQQRNKGFSCPICQKAYRAAAYKEMVKCNWCHKFVHSTCDDEADLSAYHKKKENNPDYDYVCPNCKANSTKETQIINTVELALVEAQGSDSTSIKDSEADPLDAKTSAEINFEDQQKLPNNKKKVCVSNIRGKGGKFVLQRMSALSQMGKKRARGKGRQIVLASNCTDRYVSRNMDTDVGSDKKMLLCSARDKFILAQDICVSCGSLGIESDAEMITCAQCGQCYHPYCANVKPSKGMLQKGWRCLDCTVCEGCGKKNDEARLLLCDECDISYHIYCVDPPLDTVPHGNWKCYYCTICQKCGRNSTSKGDYNSDVNVSECSPCASQTVCAVCTIAYSNDETIIKCEQCEHWLHFACDSTHTQLSTEYYDENSYKCLKCRSNGVKPQLQPGDEKQRNDSSILTQKPPATVGHQENKFTNGVERNGLMANDLLESSEAIHWIDGVCLSESGLNMIKSLSTEIKRKRKMRQTTANMNKDGQLDVAIAEEAQDKYKDGMIWDSSETPEGFTISTNEEGVNILRKKRQRNLQKLGIGGFSVRNRTLKKDNEETVDQLNPILLDQKKKKNMRKKQKNKLIEAYPPYLQEAFFGKPLLENVEILAYESDSSDEIGTTMKIFFPRTDNKIAEEDGTPVGSKDPPKMTKRIKAEKPFSVDQFPIPMQQKPVHAAVGTTMFVSEPPLTEMANNVAMNNHGVTEMDASTAGVSFVASSDNMDKTMGEAGIVIMDNYSVAQQVAQEPKFTHHGGQLYVSSSPSMTPNSTQSHYQQHEQLNMQNKLKVTQVGMQQIEKRLVEEPKPNEVAMEGINVGTQKTAEKMRKDEDLGAMATISAVLYANTEHPNLKEQYPNWNDRCKQILKRWRSLCNEKKAPFLQKAKDNRSALRQRREQSKIPLPPKSQKQDDNARAWKQHQAKPKDDQSNIFVNYAGIAYDACYPAPSSHAPLIMPTMANESLAVKSIQTEIVQSGTTKSPSIKMVAPENRMVLNNLYASEETSDKKLRNLLQKPNPEPMLLGSNSDIFLQNDVLRLGLLSNGPLENNPMLSISGKHQPTELRQNIQEQLEQDVKNQPDLKITESQEGISSSAVELENVGFGDILGRLGEGDDDDLLKSLTSEIGDEFNILEYADPELDVLNTLDFEENEKGST